MNSEPCIICNTIAELHIDDKRNRHIGCPTCGRYITTSDFSDYYLKCGPQTREDFANYMVKTKDNSDRILFKTRPLKSSSYSATEGFEMLSINRILSGQL